jgi:hypothetical protein
MFAVAPRPLGALNPAIAAEVREALSHRRRADQDFATAWRAVLRGLPKSQRELLQHDAWAWRLGYERRGSASIVQLLGVLEDASERERAVVLG